jgi:hypothetical protein
VQVQNERAKRMIEEPNTSVERQHDGVAKAARFRPKVEVKTRVVPPQRNLVIDNRITLS